MPSAVPFFVSNPNALDGYSLDELKDLVNQGVFHG